MQNLVLKMKDRRRSKITSSSPWEVQKSEVIKPHKRIYKYPEKKSNDEARQVSYSKQGIIEQIQHCSRFASSYAESSGQSQPTITAPSTNTTQ